MKKDISIVVPLFNEEESLSELFTWIKKVMNKNDFSFEVIFVETFLGSLLGSLGTPSNHENDGFV